ncbi:MAG: ATP-grasp domain-containing protein, partial [Gemmatimonadales bacterium]
NVHRRGILHTTVVPAQVPSAVAATASATAIRVAHALDYVGVLGVEMFVAAGGNIYVNEIAPRPHNSGHYTMSACVTDQFEQQVRALAELPLGSPRLLSPVCMINLLGEVWSGGTPRWEAALWLPGVSLHLYGKGEVRPGRKMGHLNCLAESPAAALALAERAYTALRQ